MNGLMYEKIQYVPSKKGNIWRIYCTIRIKFECHLIYGFSESQLCNKFREHNYEALASKGERTEKKSSMGLVLNP